MRDDATRHFASGLEFSRTDFSYPADALTKANSLQSGLRDGGGLCPATFQIGEAPPARFRGQQMAKRDCQRDGEAEQPERPGAESLHHLACAERPEGEGDSPAHGERPLVAAAKLGR